MTSELNQRSNIMIANKMMKHKKTPRKAFFLWTLKRKPIRGINPLTYDLFLQSLHAILVLREVGEAFDHHARKRV